METSRRSGAKVEARHRGTLGPNQTTKKARGLDAHTHILDLQENSARGLVETLWRSFHQQFSHLMTDNFNFMYSSYRKLLKKTG
jgi:N-formylglutamate amidohydrolase